jgi:hypothetical protein
MRSRTGAQQGPNRRGRARSGWAGRCRAGVQRARARACGESAAPGAAEGRLRPRSLQLPAQGCLRLAPSTAANKPQRTTPHPQLHPQPLPRVPSLRSRHRPSSQASSLSLRHPLHTPPSPPAFTSGCAATAAAASPSASSTRPSAASARERPWRCAGQSSSRTASSYLAHPTRTHTHTPARAEACSVPGPGRAALGALGAPVLLEGCASMQARVRPQGTAMMRGWGPGRLSGGRAALVVGVHDSANNERQAVQALKEIGHGCKWAVRSGSAVGLLG